MPGSADPAGTGFYRCRHTKRGEAQSEGLDRSPHAEWKLTGARGSGHFRSSLIGAVNYTTAVSLSCRSTLDTTVSYWRGCNLRSTRVPRVGFCLITPWSPAGSRWKAF